MNQTCLNCNTNITGSYCSSCGQNTSTSRMNLRHVISKSVSHFLNLDSVVPRTFLGLCKHPGKLIHEYIKGRRTCYVSPFRYCLTSVALLMLTYALVGRSTDYTLFQNEQPLSPMLLKFQADTMAFVMRHLNAVIFAALPLQALVLWGLFRRSKFNYAEVLSFTLYYMGHTFLMGVVLALALSAFSEIQFVLRLIIQTIFLAWAAIGFFGENRFVSVLKSVIANIINIIIVALIVIILMTPRFLGLVKEIKAEKAQAALMARETALKHTMFIIYTADQQTSRDFYAEVLGSEPKLDVPGMTEFSLKDGSSLGLMPEAGIQRLLGDALPDPAFASGTLRGEIYLLVDDPEQCLERAIKAGAKPLSQCQARNWGDLAGYCLDQDGYVLGFGKQTGEPK